MAKKPKRASALDFLSLCWHSPTITLGSEADSKGRATLTCCIHSTILRKAVCEHTCKNAQADRRTKHYYVKV